MRIRTHKAAFAVEFINIEEAAQVPGASWEPFQLRFLNNDSRFGIDVKARQIAWSFTAALDAVVDGILNPDTPHLFVSINIDEAREKIRYARSIIDAIDEPARPRMIRDSQTELEFANGSRLISHPCRPPRGKPRARIYFDEIAHYQDGIDREVYRAGLPATTKGDGYIRIGSSPLGAKGLFWEIMTESIRQYPGYDGYRNWLPWWVIGALCTDVKRAMIAAPTMLSEVRVYQFGTPALIQIFENMLLEDFQQEYECAWVDESTAWITWEIIQRNQDRNLLHWKATNVDSAIGMIDLILEAIGKGIIEQALVGGIDIGRKKDLTEFFAVGKTTTQQRPLRIMVSLDRAPYDDQQRCFEQMIERLPFTQVLIDQNGIGAQLAENLNRKFGVKAQGVDFTNATKELWAVEAKIQAERGNTPIPPDRELSYQLHSIKKSVTASKNNVFDTERNEKHHADKFWAWALAVYGSTQRSAEPAGAVIDVSATSYKSERRKGLWR